MSDDDQKVVLKPGEFFDASGYVPEGWCVKPTHQPRVMPMRHMAYSIELEDPTLTVVAGPPKQRWN